MKVLLNFFTPFYWDSESLFAISSRLHQKSVAGPQTGPGLLTTTLSWWWNNNLNRICRGKKIYCYFKNQDVSWSRPDFLRSQRGDAFNILRNVIFYFIFMKCCFLFVKVYEALKSSAVVVYIMLTAMYLIPIWIYSGINVTRLTHFWKTRWIFGVYLLV